MTDDELLSAMNDLRTLMINVATGGPRINDVNGDYQRVFASVAADLARRRIDNPIMTVCNLLERKRRIAEILRPV